MNVIEIDLLIAQYSNLSEEAKSRFANQHPEIKNTAVIERVLSDSRIFLKKGDAEASAKYAVASYCLAGEIGDKERAIQAASQAVDAFENMGESGSATTWKRAVLTLRFMK